MIKGFSNKDFEELIKEINEFGQKECIIATQTHFQLGVWYAFVYYKSAQILKENSPREETAGIMQEEPELKEIGVAYPDKKYPNKINIKFEETGKWEGFSLNSFKETVYGLEFKNLVLKQTDPEWRAQNPKRPLYKAFERAFL